MVGTGGMERGLVLNGDVDFCYEIKQLSEPKKKSRLPCIASLIRSGVYCDGTLEFTERAGRVLVTLGRV